MSYDRYTPDQTAAQGSRRAFLSNALSLVSVPVAATLPALDPAAQTAPPPQLPPALAADWTGKVARFRFLCSEVRDYWRTEGMLHGSLTPDLVRSELLWYSHQSIESLASGPAIAGFTGWAQTRSANAGCITLYLPHGLTPRREIEALAFGLAFQWSYIDGGEYLRVAPWIFGQCPYQTQAAEAVLSGLAGLPEGQTWRIQA